MSIKSHITDKATRLSAEITNQWNGDKEKAALVVATRPLKAFENTVLFFLNNDYGADMNQDASTGGTPEEVHNGTDDVLWTGSNIVGTIKAFNSTDQNHTGGGSKSVKMEKENTDDVFQFAKGSDLNCNGYVSLTMWVYVDKDWKAGDSIELYGWDTGTGLQIGDAVDLSNYFEYSSYDTWHKVTVPLIDMGGLASSTTLDALRVRQADTEGKGPKYYLDDIQFEETGDPLAFTIEPDNGTWLYVDEFTFSFADALASTLGDAGLPVLAYDKILGETLTSGVSYIREHDGEILFTQTISSIMDILQLPHTEITAQGSDGTNSFVTIRAEHHNPIILKSEHDDKLSFTISEDLSGLLSFRISAGCWVEVRS